MSHGKLREDSSCQNCGNHVEYRYCSYCGQENTETRQRFHYLFTHFIEDFVHYDGSFWTTVRTLFFEPGKVTKEYLSGKRNRWVNPVKLYIFVSFIAFFIMAIFPTKKIDQNKIYADVKTSIETSHQQLDSLRQINELSEEEYQLAKKELANKITLLNNDKVNAKELRRKIDDQAPILKPLGEKYIQLQESNMSASDKERLFKNKILSTIPKGLFIYMPLFAFVLWIFYNKKKWWYFDHGIYTLHYFSVLLLSVTFTTILSRTSDWIDIGIISFFIGCLHFILFVYLIYNFYKGANVLYTGNKYINFAKISITLLINTVIFTILLIGLLIYAFLNM